jgi:ribosomal protein L11 methyltransferase
MFELVLRAACACRGLVEPVSDALMDELDALSVSVEDADAGTDGRAGRCSASPACRRRPLRLAALDAAALFDDEAAASEAATLLLAQDWAAGCTCRPAAGGRPGLGAPDAVAVRAGGDHARVLDRAELARAAGRRPAGDPARPRPGLRHRHPPHHPHVPALDRRRARRGRSWLDRVLDYGCGSGILAIGAALHGARGVDAVDIDPAAVQATRPTRRPTA